jgi:hypothetical protein
LHDEFHATSLASSILFGAMLTEWSPAEIPAPV